MNVKRYAPMLGMYTVPVESGDYVLYSDYAALESRVKEVEAELACQCAIENKRYMDENERLRAENASLTERLKSFTKED